MKTKIILSFYISGIIASIILLLSLVIPVSFPEKHIYEFNVTYINGDKRVVHLNLPENCEYVVMSSRGDYYLRTFSYGYTIWGGKSPVKIIETDVTGVLYVNSINKK